MTQLATSPKNFWILIPVVGIFLFISLYAVAAFCYPGGSETDKNATGYSWTDNYWCNLLSEEAINGETNMARPVAIIAMFILCISLSTFWFLFPVFLQLRKRQKLLIQIAGLASMLSSFLLLTHIDHDLAINISSTFGFIATIGTLFALRQMKWNWLFVYGLFNLVLIGLNNYLYHTGQMTYLPIVQKCSFLSFLAWFSLICVSVYHLRRSQESSGN